ncbi:MAG: penicillin-insensitive murein endopeptidase [Bauldia sp.]|nr:penicillin-insensitive murein endopeptidase [Bauldia sp.]
MRRLPTLPATAFVLAATAAAAQNATPARDLFGAAATPAPMNTMAIGGYSAGCLAGGAQLAADGPNWQAMRPARNRAFGHTDTIAFIERLSADAARIAGWPGLLVGDISQPRGGPAAGGHVSHQTGLDVDIWFMPMPDYRLSAAERTNLSAISLLRPGTLEVDPARWDDRLPGLLRIAATDPAVARIFVHPGIKARLCEVAGADSAWLRTIRPWYGHEYHFHVRLACPEGEATCIPQDAIPEGDGCGAELAWWLGPEPWQPADPPTPPAAPLTLADLPPACATVLAAGGAPVVDPPLPRIPPR